MGQDERQLRKVTPSPWRRVKVVVGPGSHATVDLQAEAPSAQERRGHPGVGGALQGSLVEVDRGIWRCYRGSLY